MDQKSDIERSPISDKSVAFISDTSTVDGDSDPTGRQRSKEKRDIFSIQWFYIIFISVNLIGLILDPLFLYIPTIDEKNKCLEMDKNLSIAALIILRSIYDLPSFISFCLLTFENIWDGFKYDFKPDQEAKSLSLRLQRRGIPKTAIPFFRPVSTVIAFAKVAVAAVFNLFQLIWLLSIFPTSPVAIIVFFFRRRSYGSSIVNSFLFFQYLSRLMVLVFAVDKIYTNCSKWIKGSFNLVLYIYSSHVLGAFWYFFSIQREILCWHQACKNTPGCTATYYCDDTSTPTNIKILNDLCPINPGNATLFDFGIFLDAFQSGIIGQKSFSTKLFYCLWWGLRNISNFGTNLETSSYIWENCFAILISIVGLLLFLYFIGNVQTYMQLHVTKSEENKELHSKLNELQSMIEKKKELKKLQSERNELQSMIEKKKPMIESWVDRHHVPNFIRFELLRKQCGKKLKECIDVDVDVKGQLSILSPDEKKETVVHLCWNILKKVPMLQTMDEQVLENICEYLEPVIYTENSYVFREGNPLGLMLFIIDGTIWSYKTNGDNAAKTESGSSSNMPIKWLKKGDYYGEKLLSYYSTPNCSFSELPISMEDVQCHTKVEAFVLKAEDLRCIVNQPWWDLSKHSNSQQLKESGPPCDTSGQIQDEI